MPIDLPQDLRRVIDLARAAVASGALEEVTRSGNGRPLYQDVPFTDIPSNGPWPDTVSYSFKCTGCGAAYEFGADSYHGGGEWKRTINREPRTPNREP